MYLITETDFQLHVRLIQDTLKTHNKDLVDEFRLLFSTLISPEYFTDVLTVAIEHLYKTDCVTYQWALCNLYPATVLD